MATITVDSELMTNYVSSVPVPSGSHHVTVLDEKRMPMVFCLSNNISSPRLQILRRDAEGHSQLLDIHKTIGLPQDARVQTFHAEQSWDLKLYLAIAYQDGEDVLRSQLHLVQPFKPEQLHEGSPSLPIITGSSRFGAIQKITMAPISGTNSDIAYPDVFLVHHELDQSASWGKDISHIHVRNKFRGWFATQELDTPENVSEILDIAPACSSYGQGLYILYVTQGKTKLYARYLRPDPNATDGTMYTFTTSVSCPEGARCVASILGANGRSSLLIGVPGGIQYLTSSESVSKDKPGKLIFVDNMFKNIRQLQVTQDKTDVAIWFRNNKDELGYIRTKSDKVADSAASSLLLPAGMSSAFSPVITTAHESTGHAVRQMVVSNDLSGNLLLIEQSDDIGLWRKTPFYKPSTTQPTPLKSYTLTVKAKDDKNNALSSGSLRVSASSTISIILNGRNVLLTTIPTWLDCDQAGNLDFIIPSDSLGSQKLVIDQVRSDNGVILPFKRVEYDPSHKPMQLLSQKLSSVGSVTEFQDMKTESGQPLFEQSVKDDQDLMKGAHRCLQTVSSAYQSVQSQGASSAAAQGVGMRTTASLVARANASSEDFGDLLMDGFFWLREKFDEVTDWLIDTAGTVWKFVCKIAGVVKEFVLDCAEKICEAATWIWEKVKIGWEKLVEFIGFIFNWDDILTTKNTISSTITAGFGYAALKMDDIQAKVDGFFDNLETTIDKFGSDLKLDKQLGGSSSPKDDKVESAQSSTSTTWASERLKNGGAGTNTKIDFKGDKKSDAATTFWESSVVPEITKLNAAMSKVGQDITGAFRKEGSIDGNDVLIISKDLLKAGITAVRAVVKGLLQLVKTFIGKLADLGNAEINIPIFSWLYKQISGGHALTLFDAISLVVAIPTTVFAKLITGKAPPTFRNVDGNMMRNLVEGKDVDAGTVSDWAVFRAEVVVGITLTSGAVSVIKLLYKTATQGLDEVLDALNTGPASLFDVFGIIVDMIGCLMAIPEQNDMPGAVYRNMISGISCFRGIYHTVAVFAKGKIALENVILVFDLLTVLANLGLSIAVGVEELKVGASYKDYDEEATSTGFVTSGLNALAGIAYFTAFFFKTQPEISAAGAAVMVGTIAGGAALQGICFKLQYDKTKRAALASPPPF